MENPIRWTTRDRFGHEIYLTDERWMHITEAINHPEMIDFENHLKETVENGDRKADPLNARKFRYSKRFSDLAEFNTHVVCIVRFGFTEAENGLLRPNNFIVTAYQKEIG
jgi:hypothetical protein